jgi:Rad3-related DNA helicase
MESPLESPNEPLMDFYFDALQFTRLAESFGPHSLCDWSRSDGTVDGKTAGAGRGYGLSALCIRNVVPGPFLQPRFAAARSATLFSATMQPAHFYVDLLGLPADTAVVDIDSPFEAGQLQVHIAPLSTRFADRQRSLPALVDRMAAQFQARPGNYLAFFSSHDYLQQACAAMAWQHPQITCWAQTRGMTEADQRAFLARLTPDSQGIGFAVLGGSFAEGVDLPGRRLIGAFIATLGLPQINPVNEQMRLRLHALTGAGYDYTYVFPGLQKVVQAAGRVIRGAHDRGVLHLMDDRYLQPRIQRLLPAWWSLA